MKTKTLFTLLALFLAGVSARAGEKVLQFTSVSGTTNGMVLNSPLLNGKPSLKLVITQDLSPTDVYNDAPVGVMYVGSLKKWEIFNEDNSDIPLGASFNVLISTTAFQVNANATNSEADWTFFSQEKKNPKALLLLTHEANPAQTLSDPLYTDNNLGVWYYGDSNSTAPDINKWAVYNEDESSPLPVAYNLADVTKDHGAFIVTTSTSNATANYVIFDNAVTDGDSNAVVFVTHIYNPPNSTPNYLNDPVGVWYNGSYWTIFTEDGSEMPAGINFVVDAFPKANP
ncbi:MAG TPA: hypothetical protein VHY22_16150 [Chthoniobacteraceae bacterium]|jgi:hypothetical protein|nr:hypothetical protein [Chthoniobacteraceae bacterium]